MRLPDWVIKLPKQQCPQCGAVVDSAGGLDKGGPIPGPGDAIMCIECLVLNVIQDDLSLRRMTLREMEALEPEHRADLERLKRLIAVVNQIPPPTGDN